MIGGGRRGRSGALRDFFLLPASRRITSRQLAKLILASLKLHPIALAAQTIGIAAMDATFWQSAVSDVFLALWSAAGAVQIWLSLLFVRRFWRDRDRVERIRLWIRRWTALAAAAGVIWGIAGVAFMVPHSGIQQIVPVAVIAGVTFASWPVYSCWMPSLTVFTLLSLAPLSLAVGSQFGVSQTIVALIVLVVTCFVLYSGRRLNEMVLSSILTESRNHRLVQRLKTEINRAEAARRTTQAESERRARFFAAANHDIRQPLQAMGIFLDILKRRADPRTEPVIRQLSETSRTISTLVEQILEVTRMEFGRIETRPEEVRVRPLVESLAKEFAPIAREKGLILRTRAVDACVRTDPQLLSRALRNLISNAIRYTTKPGAEVLVAAHRMGGGRVALCVCDAGPGMSREDCRRIFETFYRGSAGKSQPGSGFGLGLSIVRGICRQLGIELMVGARLGRGSLFRLALPEADASGSVPAPSAPASAELDAPIDATVLLLEDDDVVREALRGRIEGWGADVLAAARPDARFFNSAVEAAVPLVFVSDYNFGEGEPTGLDAGAEIERLRGAPVPMILVTAVARDLIAAEYAKRVKTGAPRPSGLKRILQKPVTAEALREALLDALR